MILDLITTNWEVTETRQIQDNSIPSKYKATCYYATKKRVDNPLTYIVTAEYNGTADKVIENDFISSLSPTTIVSSAFLFALNTLNLFIKNIDIIIVKITRITTNNINFVPLFIFKHPLYNNIYCIWSYIVRFV